MRTDWIQYSLAAHSNTNFLTSNAIEIFIHSIMTNYTASVSKVPVSGGRRLRVNVNQQSVESDLHRAALDVPLRRID